MENILLGSNLQYYKFPFSAFLETQEKHGITALDLAQISPHIYVDSEEVVDPYDITKKLKEKNIAVQAVTAMPYRYSVCSSPETIQNEKTIGYYQQCILFAQKIGAKYVLVTASGAEYDQSCTVLMDNAIRTLSVLSSFALTHNVSLLFGTVLGEESPNNSSTPVLTHLWEVKELLSQVHSPGLKAYLDTLAASLAGETISQWFDMFGENLCLVRFTDGNYNGYRVWGTGCLPCKKFLNELKMNGFHGPLSLAVPGERYSDMPAKAENELLTNLRTALLQVS